MNPLAARYLYGLEEPLDREVVEAYVTTLVRIAKVSKILESESRVLQGVADSLGAPPFLLSRLMRSTDEAGDLEESLAALRSRKTLLVTLYRDALLVAQADGVVESGEAELLVQVAVKLGLSEAQRKLAEDAAAQLEALRKAMTALAH